MILLFALASSRPDTRGLLNSFWILASGFWLLVFVFLFSSCAPRQPGEQAKETRITAASGVRLRSEPAESAGEITRLGVGTVLRVVEQSSNWYRVSTPDGKEGWVFGGHTAAFEAADRDSIYRKIADDRLKVEDATFADLVDLARFLTAASSEVEDREAKAELELARLLAIKRALDEIPVQKQQERQYAAWVESLEDEVVYNEPAGQWLVRSDLFWDLQERYKDLAIAERIAWEGADNPLPGECEGYFPCYLAYFNRTKGKYLELYPAGAHAEEAIAEIAESLEETRATMEGAPSPDPDERAEARKELLQLRETVGKASGEKKADLLKHVDEYLKYYGVA
ncbi:MAG TPA: SH3 domain-containing protein [Blastocatellia bacterium]|nr:SH3 domain-containing protein [Blastocatellia bacterium]